MMVRIASLWCPRTGSRQLILSVAQTLLLSAFVLGFTGSALAQDEAASEMAVEIADETAERVMEDAGVDDAVMNKAEAAVEDGEQAAPAEETTEQVAEEAATEEAAAETKPAPKKSTEVDPNAFAGPPADREPADLETAKLIRMGRSMDQDNRINTRINRYINAAIEKQEEDGPEASLKLLARLNPKRLNRMERASVARIAASLHYSMGDTEAAIRSFKEAIGEETLPIDQETDMRFNIAQLRASKHQWDEAIEALYEWFRWAEEDKPIPYYLLGIANFQLKRPDMAIVNTEKAIEVAKKVKEPWLQLLAALYVQKQNYLKAVPVLERLVLEFPKKQYWVQLGLIYGALDNYRTSLAVQQVAYSQGFLTDDKDLRRLARSYLYADLPYPAAQVLDKGIADGIIEHDSKGLELLANSWIASREYEKSMPPLIEAAEIADNGDLYVRLGQVNLQREEWKAAADSLEKAIEKGELTNPGNAKLLLGIAYYNSGESFRSKRWFIEAMEYDKTRSDGKKWIDHIENEANQE